MYKLDCSLLKKHDPALLQTESTLCYFVFKCLENKLASKLFTGLFILAALQPDPTVTSAPPPPERGPKQK